MNQIALQVLTSPAALGSTPPLLRQKSPEWTGLLVPALRAAAPGHPPRIRLHHVLILINEARYWTG